MTKPIVVFSLSVGVLIAGLYMSAAGTALSVAGVFVSMLGGVMFGFSLEHSFNGFLSKLSQAYSDQSQRASEHIRALEASDDEMMFVFT